MSVTITQVRNLLDQVPAASVPDDTITANITRSTNFVTNVQDPDASVTDVEDAIIAMAVWLTYGSYAEGISEQLGSVADAVKVKMDHYMQVAELFINRISREPIDLSMDNVAEESLEGVDISVYTLTTSEAYSQG